MRCGGQGDGGSDAGLGDGSNAGEWRAGCGGTGQALMELLRAAEVKYRVPKVVSCPSARPGGCGWLCSCCSA